jgi:hypothetical protein
MSSTTVSSNLTQLSQIVKMRWTTQNSLLSPKTLSRCVFDDMKRRSSSTPSRICLPSSSGISGLGSRRWKSDQSTTSTTTTTAAGEKLSNQCQEILMPTKEQLRIVAFRAAIPVGFIILVPLQY